MCMLSAMIPKGPFTNTWGLLLLIFQFFGLRSSSNILTASNSMNVRCPNFKSLKVDERVTPWGNKTAGKYLSVDASNLQECVQLCCDQDNCDVAFSFNLTHCFLISCYTEKDCHPLNRKGSKFELSYMVRVRPTDPNASYLRLPDKTPNLDYLSDDTFSAETESTIFDGTSDKLSTDDSDAPVLSASRKKACIVGIQDCTPNEHCVAMNNRARHGICVCNQGFDKSDCLTSTSETTSFSSPTPAANKHLVVSAGGNKELYLPESSVTLSAYAIPKPEEGDAYRFEWTLVSHPDGDDPGAMEDQNTPNLKLSKLRPGVYTFKVLVTGKDAIGDNQVNVTVFPAKHANKPPIAIIQPDNVTVQLPNRDTVLDGSFSKDYEQIVAYHWEAVAVPIGYSLQVNNTPTLQLKNLVPGFYRFKLTVTNTQGASNFTFANVTVLKETDYPPTANAGDDVVIYLPTNEALLNGSLSTDDKGIKSWQWQQVKSSDANQPADVEGTTSPILHLSHLDVGVYKFQLKVTDTADQTSVAEVRVFVKPDNNKPPKADAGPDQKVSLPLKGFLLLDGSASSGDSVPVRWHWEQVRGPKPSKIDDADKVKAKVSNLFPGDYVFQLTVFDSKNVNGTANVTVSVIQTKNSAPKAVAGGDKTVYLPSDVVFINGSLSIDDVDIVSYQWKREPSSLAVGDIIEDSSHKPVLKLINLIPGRYLFRLTVTDNQGATGTDTTSLIVKSSPDLLQHVETILNADIKAFTHEQLEMLLKQLELLVHDNNEPVKVQLINLYADQLSRRVTIVFVVKKNYNTKNEGFIPGPDVVFRLKHKLRTDSSILSLEVLAVHTVVCQNRCSGHGSCDPYTKHCICEAFWMENWFKARFGDQESNCDWSVLYVIIVFLLILLSLIGAIWSITCFCSRMKFRRRKRRPRYMLLEEMSDKEKEISFKSRGKQQQSSLMISESDSDTVYESRLKPLLNGVQPKNGMVKKVRA